MDYIEKAKHYKVKDNFFFDYLYKYWFIPSDVLQRSIEANVWDKCHFQTPVLDIGIGNGAIANYIFKRHVSFDVGIDLNNQGVKIAAKNKKYKKVICMDAQNMTFANNTFNTIVSNSTFEHIQNDKKAISEVARVLKNSGLLFLTVPSVFLQEWIFLYEKQRKENTAKSKLIKFNQRTSHLHYRSLEAWKEIMRKNNLEIIFSRYYFSRPVAIYWYKLFKISTTRIGNSELWSLLSYFDKFLFFRNTIVKFVGIFFLKNKYDTAFFTDDEPGAQLLIIAKKTRAIA